ncbi:MAG: hypothetical protein NT105_18930 [Verrucomicrobia bacterium]|nr:hypothetical protein [Verrucomicrobiota bacterium]
MADIPRPDDGLSRWLDQFLSAATDNATALGLSPTDLSELGAKIPSTTITFPQQRQLEFPTDESLLVALL